MNLHCWIDVSTPSLFNFLPPSKREIIYYSASNVDHYHLGPYWCIPILQHSQLLSVLEHFWSAKPLNYFPSRHTLISLIQFVLNSNRFAFSYYIYHPLSGYGHEHLSGFLPCEPIHGAAWNSSPLKTFNLVQGHSRYLLSIPLIGSDVFTQQLESTVNVKKRNDRFIIIS